jgi:secondary thiamine-phosphate synthase enzyme
MKEISIKTNKKSEMIDITSIVEEEVQKGKIQQGMCFLYVPHTTAGLTINENTDPNVPSDILRALDKLVPWAGDYSHLEGNSAAHIKSTIFGVSKSIFIKNGQINLGQWQSIFFCEFDGPRQRKLYIKIE